MLIEPSSNNWISMKYVSGSFSKNQAEIQIDA